MSTQLNLASQCRKFLQKCLTYCAGDRVCHRPWILCTLGRLFLITIPNTEFFKAWKLRLQALGVHLDMYNQDWIESQFGVYAYLSPDCAHSYIGAMEVTLASRHNSRVRKLRQVCSGRLVECEVALRYWQSSRTFPRYIPLLIRKVFSKQAALTEESILQQQFQPSLVMPWICQHFKKSGFDTQRIKCTRAGLKLYKRFRFRN